jgi:hypothetical protein
MIGNLLYIDIFSAWMTSFSAKEASAMPFERPFLFFFYYVIALSLTSSAFNCYGYVLQMFYCIFLEGGSYSSGKNKVKKKENKVITHSSNINTRTMALIARLSIYGRFHA